MIRLACSAGGRLAAPAEQQAAAGELLRHSLMADFGIAAAPDDMVRNRWGKPSLRDWPQIHFSVSHCAGGVACVTGRCRNGVDIERLRPFDAAVARKVLSAEEQAVLARSSWPERDFFRFWTLKESCLKALGTGIAMPPAMISFEFGAGGAVRCSLKHGRFRLLEDPAGFIAAICLLDVHHPADPESEPVDWQYLA